MITYVIGDIHGQLQLLRAAHARIEKDRLARDSQDWVVVHLGDYCDRGPDTAGVLEFLSRGTMEGAPWVCLLGNHDRMMRLFLNNPSLDDPLRDDLSWLDSNIGGRLSLASYGIEDAVYADRHDLEQRARSLVPAHHKAFLKDLPTHFIRDGVFYCHAGVRPGVPLDDQVENDLVWIREPFNSSSVNHGALVVHGHTPVAQATHFGNHLNLDSGAAYGGPLTTAVLEDGEVWLLEATGRVWLKPLTPAI